MWKDFMENATTSSLRELGWGLKDEYDYDFILIINN